MDQSSRESFISNTCYSLECKKIMGILSLFGDSVRETFTGGWSEEELISAINRTFLDHRKNNPALLGELSICLCVCLCLFLFQNWLPDLGSWFFTPSIFCQCQLQFLCMCVLFVFILNTLASNEVLSVNCVAVCMYQSYTRRSRNNKDQGIIKIKE